MDDGRACDGRTGLTIDGLGRPSRNPTGAQQSSRADRSRGRVSRIVPTRKASPSSVGPGAGSGWSLVLGRFDWAWHRRRKHLTMVRPQHADGRVGSGHHTALGKWAACGQGKAEILTAGSVEQAERVSRCTRDEMKRRSGATRPMVTPETESCRTAEPAAQGNRRRCLCLQTQLPIPRFEQAGRASGQGSGKSSVDLRSSLTRSVCRCGDVVCQSGVVVCVVRWFVQVGAPEGGTGHEPWGGRT